MSDPVKPGWPDASALPFSMFGAANPASGANAAQPLAQGLAGGMEMIRNFWGNLPGGTALPGFLVPTIDVEELDKRLSDLRAAESWLSVNLNMLRATIQGLEVQRHTIAAIQSLSAMPNSPLAQKPAAIGGLPAGWPAAAAPAEAPKAAPAAAPQAAPAASSPPAASAPETADEPAPAAEPAPLLAGLAAGNWLGFMQDQFSKVAQAALNPATAVAPAATKVARSTAKSAAKKAVRRRPAARKTTAAR